MILFLVILLTSSIRAQDINSDIEKYLHQKLYGYDKIEFSILNDLKESHFKIDFSRDLIVKGATAYLPVKIVKGEKSLNSIITLQLKLFKKVPVATRDINRKEKLDSSDIAFQSVDITSLRNQEPENNFKPEGFRAKTNIKVGQVITKDLIELIPMVQSGEKLTAECIKGSVVISTEAIARQDGRANEVIDILTVSNELLKAKVIGPQKVLVE